MRKCLLLILVFVFISTLPAFAIYKWTDSNGVVHFTDYPPKNSDKEYEDVDFNKNLSDMNDSFGDGLIGKGWIRFNIDNSDILDESGDSLTINAPGDSDIWYDRFDAPVLFKKIKKADKNFTVEVKLHFETNGSDKGGVVIWTDKSGKGDVVLICKSKDEDINFRRIIGSDSQKGTEPTYDKENVIFRLSREEDRIKGSYSEDGGDWTDLGEVDFPVEGPLNIGIFGCSWKSNPAKIIFDYFSVSEQ